MPVDRDSNAPNVRNETSMQQALVSELHRGNIFEFVRGPGPRLTIVFGHCGYSEMAPSWGAFRDSNPGLRNITDPFESADWPLRLESNTWLWFVPAGTNHGMVDADLLATLNTAFDWARAKGIRYVVTNGIRDVDHGMSRSANRASDDRRTAMLTKYLAERERADHLRVTLVSLNEVFVRYWSM